MSYKTDNFINTIAPIAQNEFNSREIWILPSVCIAQAALESGWNLNASTLFGIKGEGIKATTGEWYQDHYETIEASFQYYPDIASAVVGYYDLITTAPWYRDACNTYDYRQAVYGLQHDESGLQYATSPTYEANIISIIEQYDLTRFDVRESSGASIGYNGTKKNTENYTGNGASQGLKDNDTIALEVIRGEWGNGSERVNRLSAAGYDYNAIQSIVNAYYGVGTPEPPKAPEPTFEIGRGVRIRQGAKDLNSDVYFADWVYNTEYYIKEINGNRIVFGNDNGITGVVDKADIILI